MIKHLYYYESTAKDLETKDKGEVLSESKYIAQRNASNRQRKHRTGWWETKHIGQTPRRHIFRVRFSYDTDLNSQSPE